MGQIPAHRAVLGIHRIAGCDEGHDAARSDLIEGLCEEIVVDGKTELVVSPVVDLILSEGDVADSHVIEVAPIRGLKACNGDVGVGIELLGDSAGHAVQLHAVELRR